MNTEVVDKLDALFSASRFKFETLASKYSGEFIYDHNDELTEFFNDSPSGLRWLLTLFIGWKRRKLFKNEIGKNLKDDKQGYFKFLDNVFGQQYMLIKDFKESLHIYQNDNKRAIDIISALNEGDLLDKDQFIMSVELYYIDVYHLLELYVAGLYSPFAVRLNLTSNCIPAFKTLPNKKDKPAFEVVNLDDQQIRNLYNELLLSEFIDKSTKYQSFKHILIQKNLIDSDLIRWIDLADNKRVNKITILQFVSQVVKGSVSVQNDFIITYFRKGNDDEDELINKDSLKNSRRIFNAEKMIKNKRTLVIKDLIVKSIEK